MHVHIGKKIEERMREVRMSPAFLAEKINTTRQNMYGIFRRKSIDTDLLVKISEALEFNFFSLYQFPGVKKEAPVSRLEFEDLVTMVKEIRKEYNLTKSRIDQKKGRK